MVSITLILIIYDKSVKEFTSIEEAKKRTGKWIEIDYIKLYVNSGLGYMSPEEIYNNNLAKETA